MTSHRVHLECTTGGSNKFYTLWLVEIKGGFVVAGHSGAIGKAGIDREVTPRDKPMPEWQAIDKLEAFAAKKVSRSGYVRVSGPDESPQAAAPDHNFRIRGGLRAVSGMFKALAKKDAAVAAAVAALSQGASYPAWRPLLGIHAPEFPLVLALCRAGKAELRYGADLCDRKAQAALIQELSYIPDGYALSIAIDLIVNPKMDFAAAIGVEASGLAL